VGDAVVGGGDAVEDVGNNVYVDIAVVVGIEYV